MPFAQIVAITTLLGALISKERKRIPLNGVVLTWFFFLVWLSLTTLFALEGENAVLGWEKNMKIQFMTFLTIMVIQTPERIRALVWVSVLSIGIYGIKGGLWTALTGGQHRVLGPADTFIQGNTEIGLALSMVIPLMIFLWHESQNKWVRWAMLGAALSTCVAVLGTHSRGALLGLIAVCVALVLTSRHKIKLVVIAALAVPLMVSLMPQQWFDRMHTIQSYESDHSAMQRLTAWQVGIRMARERPLLGAGFRAFNPENYRRFAPDIVDRAASYGVPEELVFQDAHSIYFGVLGEHGYPGLALFLMLGFGAFLMAARTAKLASGREDLEWAGNLVRMVSVGLVAFAVSGAFLSLAYFDLAYQYIAIIVVCHEVVQRHIEKAGQPGHFTPMMGNQEKSITHSFPALERSEVNRG